MSDIYIYSKGNDDYSTIGECGALDATSCLFEEVANGESELTLEHPIDALGKFAYLVPDAILKAEVPVRNVPEIRAGRFVTSVESWTVKATATKNQRYLYKKQEKGSKVRLLDVGAQVVVTSKPEGSERWKAVSGKYSGWIASAALESRVDVTIPDSPTGMESAVSPWECRDQLFRIYKVTRSESGITASARHISYDLLYNLTTYESDEEVELQDALTGVLDHCLDAHEFSARTDIKGARSGIRTADKNPIEAILDPEEGLAARWNAQLVRDDYELFLLSRAGGNRGMSIEYAKNLTGVEVDEDLSNVATAIRPTGETKDGKPLYLPENNGLVVSPLADNYPFRRIQTLQCDDCKIGTNDVKEDLAYQRMREQAQAALDNGADLPTVSAKVTFAQLGSGVRYAQYRALESVYLYDEIRVSYPGIGVELTTEVVRVIWDCVRGCMDSIELGSLQALTPSVAGWQIPGGLNGGKIAQGTIGGGALANGVISARHIQSETINTEHLQAGSVVTDKLAAGSVTAEKLAAGAITADNVKAGMIEALTAYLSEITSENVSTDNLAAQMARIEVLVAGSAEFDRETVSHLVAEAMHLQFGEADQVFINNLAVGYAQMVSAAVGDLVVKSSEGRYYHLDVAGDGSVTATEVTVTEGEIAAGQTGDGRAILETNITARNLSTTNLFATYGLVNRLDAARIDVDQLFAREALIEKLKSTKIVGEKSLEIIVGDAEQAQKDAEAAKQAVDGSVASVVVEYYLSDSPETPKGGSWSADSPAWREGKYIWSRTRTTTQGGAPSYSAPSCITGNTGQQGVGVREIVTEYYLSTSNAEQTGGTWSTTEPAWREGCFLWTRSRITWTDGNATTTTPVLAEAINSANEASRSAQDAADGARDAANSAMSEVRSVDDITREMREQLRQHFLFDQVEGLIIQLRDGDGNPVSIWSTQIDEKGFYVRRADLAEPVFAAERDVCRALNLEIGANTRIVAKGTATGGVVWTTSASLA